MGLYLILLEAHEKYKVSSQKTIYFKVFLFNSIIQRKDNRQISRNIVVERLYKNIFKIPAQLIRLSLPWK